MSFIIIMLIFIYASFIERQYELEVLRKKDTDLTIIAINELESLIDEHINKALGLSVFYTESDDISNEMLTDFSEILFKSSEDIVDSVILTNDTTVFFEFPTRDENSSIDSDLFSKADIGNAVDKAMKSNRIVITDPYELEFGKQGVSCLVPIFTYKEGIKNDLIGLMDITLSFDRLLGESGLLQLTKEYNLVISASDDYQKDENIIFSSSQILPTNPIHINLSLPNTTWKVQISPIDDWQNSLIIDKIILNIGVVFALWVAFYINGLLHSKELLNKKVDQRTKELIDLNDELEQSLENLSTTQEQLIRSEKLAALGELVCGVAHEINTPLGVGLTLASFVENKNSELNSILEDNRLRLQDLQDHISSVDEASKSMITNLEKAAEIVTNFKNVAADQSATEIKEFDICGEFNEIIMEQLSRQKNIKHKIELKCPDKLVITSYPNTLSHILNNLIANSIAHGFDGIDHGLINISIMRVNNDVEIYYKDNGIGISEEVVSKVFNPFFTTKRGEYPGLGLHIVHNMISLVLKGKIDLVSTPNNGVEYKIVFTPKSFSN